MNEKDLDQDREIEKLKERIISTEFAIKEANTNTSHVKAALARHKDAVHKYNAAKEKEAKEHYSKTLRHGVIIGIISWGAALIFGILGYYYGYKWLDKQEPKIVKEINEAGAE